MVAVSVGTRETLCRGAESRVPRRRARRFAALLVGVVSLIAGCRANDPITYQVTPAILDEVRSIGLVQAEDSVELYMGDSVDVMNTFVIDVGGASANAATAKSARLLRKRGWEVIGEERPWFIMMKSTKWAASLAISSFRSVHLSSHPDILKTLKDKSAKTEASVIINVEVDHEQ